ncbi:MAG: glycoside hydrolase family protein [Nanoarchaeota archaeon]
MNIGKVIYTGITAFSLVGAALTVQAETLEQQLMRHEGFRSFAYKDRNGYTIGIGTHLGKTQARQHEAELARLGLSYDKLIRKEQGVSLKQALWLRDQDIAKARKDAPKAIKNYSEQPQEVQEVVANMIYNMGLAGFQEFKRLRHRIETHNYTMAAEAIKRSDFYKDKGTHRRAEELRQQILKAAGKYK